jgi:hypothetical protein
METKDNIVSATDLNQQVEIWISDDGNYENISWSSVYIGFFLLKF